MYRDLIVKKMGKSKEPILKIKTQDFKKLSAQFEEEAKRQSEKKKLDSKKRKIEMMGKYDVDLGGGSSHYANHHLNQHSPYRNRSSDNEKSLIQNSKESTVNIIPVKFKLVNPVEKMKEERRKMKQKTAEELKEESGKRENKQREEKEKEQIMVLVKEYLDYYTVPYHYFYRTPYSKTKIHISCFKEDSVSPVPTDDNQLLESDYARCYDVTLISIKNLARYDCWEDTDPEEWIRLCNENTKEYDGISPLYENNEYVWKFVKVVEYDPSQMRYKIIFVHSDHPKFVSRLSLLFFCENKKEFDYRKFLCEQRRSSVDEYLLFTRYLDAVPLELISSFSPKWERKILNFLKFSTRRLASKYNYLFIPNRPNFDREITVVKQDYSRQMKKMRMLMEMQEAENEEMFESRSLKIREFFREIRIPLVGIKIPDSERNIQGVNKKFKAKLDELNKNSFFEDRELSKVIVKFLKECEELKKMQILLPGMDETKLPLTLQDYIRIRDEYNKKSDYSIITKCTFDLKNLIMDNLGEIKIENEKKSIKKYDFYMVEPQLYPISRVKKVLQYFNYILHNKVKEMIDKSINTYMKYFCRFEECDYQNKYYEESKIPLFNTKLKLKEIVEKEKKEGKEKDSKHSKYEIVFEPKLEDFGHHFLKSFVIIKDIIARITDLMSQSIKVVELEKKQVFYLTDDYPVYSDARKLLEEILENSKKEARKRREEFKIYEKLLSTTAESYVTSKLGDKHITNKKLNIEKCEEMLIKFYQMDKEVDLLESEINLRMFRIYSDEIKQGIKERIDQIKLAIIERMKAYSNSRMHDLQKESEGKIKILSGDPEDINRYKELYDILQGTPEYVDQKKQELKNVGDIIEIIERQSNDVDKLFRDLLMSWKIPLDIMECYQRRKEDIEFKKNEFANKLDETKKQFVSDVLKLEEDFEKIQKVDSLSTIDEEGRPYYFYITGFNSRLLQIIKCKEEIKRTTKILFPDKAKAIDDGEEDFPKFDKLESINNDFKSYKTVWDESNDILPTYKNNIDQPLNELKPIVTQGVAAKEIFPYVKQLEESKARIEDVAKKSSYDATLIKLTSTMKEKIKEFESYNWIITCLMSTFMEEVDWKEIRAMMNNPSLSDTMSLTKLKDEKINEFRDRIEMIKSKAVRRHGYTLELKELQSAYNAIRLIEPKDGKSLKGIDDIQILLDEQSNKLVNIISNPVTQSNKTLKENSKTHNDRIKNVQMILEEILKFQSNYLYLEPIFTAPEINKELADLRTEFLKVNSFWKLVLDNMMNSGWGLAEYMDKENPQNLLTLFQTNNASLSKIIFKLNIYLNVKRTEFPRFYFVSDEDLMKILAQSRNPLLIQPHIGKCFEGMSKVVFDSSNSIIEAMESGGEVVELNRKVNVNDQVCRGNVEIWLCQLEESMRKTVEHMIKISLEDFHQKKRIDWIKTQWPGQVVQVVDGISWTAEVERGILDSQNGGLESYLKQLDDDLLDVVELVRTDVPKALSTTLSGLIVVSVHNRDIVDSLRAKDIRSTEDFDWIAQMRYIWKEGPYKKNDVPCPLKVYMVTSCLNYGFEYLGNITRLVITPLTDRCFRTLFGAYQMYYGGAPEGPAGTGKTESVKDLSKAVGIMCNVFNCTEGIKIQGMSKFFKGLASSGCWCCFDEFNRIDTEVLSVIAQQVLTIQNALKAGLSQFFFEESEKITLKETSAINITMNPSYSGRNALPDNLKALFRPCAMMVADYYLIAQIKLYSFGFATAKVLSNKIVTSLKLSSEQLSTQSHYDFGMRSLNAILLAAGKIKKKNPEIEEDRIALRALVDVNLPKFTSNDAPLFQGIVGDLFPKTKILESDLSILEEELKNTCNTNNLQPTPNFIKKCIQLFETLNVRHALMVVGRPGICKSKVLSTLKVTLGNLKGKGPNYNNVEVNTLNPKSIQQKQLYGYFDVTQEWKKGLLQVKMSELVEKEKELFKWLVFDGPVDTLWIENMNSLLDDNKKLCLEDSSSIMLGENMNIIFEVDDLKEASPATVSRNGMVLCEQDTIDCKDLIESYANTLPHNVFDAKLMNQFKENSNFLTKCIIIYIFKYAQFGLPTDRFHLVKCYLEIFECFMKDYKNTDEVITKEREMTSEKLESLMIFSCLIGLLGPVKKPPKFQEFLYDLIIGNDVNTKFELGILEWTPKRLNAKLNDIEDIFDMVYNVELNKWIKWTEIPQKKEFKVSEELKFSELVIPTPDTIKIGWMMNMIVPIRKNLLITGNTGTGKTLTVINMLNNQYENDQYTFIKLSFTAQTTASFTQSVIEGKLQKSYRKFSPSNSRKGVIFIDDLNMPQKEKFGAQPPIELLRQWMDYNGWYDLISDTKDFINIIDVCFIAAMGSVASGRTVSTRYTRHFLVHYAESYSQQTMFRIFSYVMDWFFMKTKNPSFNEKITGNKENVINATIQMYLGASNSFKATPAKTHYTFNLRDVSRVFQGIAKSNGRTLRDDSDLVKVWIHECERVFKDRLVNEDDRSQYDHLIANVMKTVMKRNDFNSYIKDGPILFGDFVPMIHIDNDVKKPCIPNQYCELSNKTKLKAELEDKLEKYNEEIGRGDSSSSLSLVLFNYAVEHIIRISRIISTQNGNGLLVGVGGSGRKSLTMLATFIYSFTPFQIENANNMDKNAWRESLKPLITEYALAGKETVFIISDTQISDDTFLEDINNMLNNGEIPNLFEAQEIQNNKDNIPQEFTMNKKLATDSEILGAIVECCKAKIHVVLSMSPIGDNFRKRIMMFPSLVNCTTIDWFLPWPSDALLAVADYYLAGCKDINDQYLKEISNICVDMQSRVIKYSERYYNELRRYYYVTPMSYIELLNIFKNLITRRTSEIRNEINRYEMGLKILEESEEIASKMQIYIKEELNPKLEKEQKDCNEKIKFLAELNIVLQKEEAEGQKAEDEGIFSENEAKSKNEMALDKLKIIEDCKKNAEEKLSNVKQEDVMLLKKSANDKYITEFCRLLCMLMLDKPHPKPSIKPANPKDPMLRDYFGYAVANLFKGDFLKEYKGFDVTKMQRDNMEELRKELEVSEFEPEKKSQQLKSLFDILKIHNQVYFINLDYIPTKEMAENASKQYKQSQESLKIIRDKLANTRRTKQEKEEEKIQKEKRIEELSRELDRCKTRLHNAKELIGSLASEKTNWLARRNELEANSTNIIGDILISSGIIAYLGAFTKSFRNEIIESWAHKIKAGGIPISFNKPAFQIMRGIVSEEMEIENWKAQKLPNDAFSIDNAIIINQSRRCCLLIDPQNQAFDWIQEKTKIESEQLMQQQKNIDKHQGNRKNNEHVKFFYEIKPTMDRATQLKIAAECVVNGYTMIYSNAGEVLSPYLGPLYKKEYIQEGPGQFSVNLEGKGNMNRKDIHPNFRFYITTKLPKPHYLPEICVAITLVNFTVTEDGLEDQMLNFLVEREDPQTDMARRNCIEKKNSGNRTKKEIEKEILDLLNQTSSNKSDNASILDNVELINKLRQSKESSKSIEESLISQIETEKLIESKRSFYKTVATHVAQLFFTVSDLSNIEPVYQYSLKSYKDIFNLAIMATPNPPPSEKNKKLDMLKENFTSMLYDKVCMSLFEKDKIVFSFLLMIKISMIPMNPDQQAQFNKECRLLVTGGSGKEFDLPNPAKNEEIPWLSNSSWNALNELVSASPTLKNLEKSFIDNTEIWKRTMTSNNPVEEPFPSPFDNLDFFYKILIVRLVRPDRTIPAVKTHIGNVLGSRYTVAPPLNFFKAYNESRTDTPILFILSAGADPLVIIENLCKKMDKDVLDHIKNISLGQGQEETARNSIEFGIKNEKWIVLQNCHLAKSFMNELEKIIDNIEYNETSNFRLFLTAMPSTVIPISIIQNSIKLTNEPPRGLKQSILRSYGTIEEKDYESCAKMPYAYKRFIYSFCFFHALILERRKYGPLGWNIPYEFSNSDLSISLKQLRMFLDKYAEIQWEALNYMIAEANYGGRVTDPADRRLIGNIFHDICNKDMLNVNYRFSGMKEYVIPPDGKYEDHIKFVSNIPDNDSPGIFGLHENADITCAINETNDVFGAALLTLPRMTSNKSGASPEEEVRAKAQDLLSRMPPKFNVEDVMMKHPNMPSESLNSVLHQELMRYNNLINIVQISMKNLIDAVNGDAVMTSDLENILQRIYDNKIPANIEKMSYPSLKSFSSWFNDLLDKLNFMQKWIDEGIPNTFWISGFFFTQSFLTGILQNYARKHKIAIDELKYDFTIMTKLEDYNLNERPEDGCYIYGFYIEGARWDSGKIYNIKIIKNYFLNLLETNTLEDPLPKVLYPSLPYVWFRPVQKEAVKNMGYECPVYRTSKRAGELSTTGQSTNFLIYMCKNEYLFIIFIL
jgi:dynein heavy chain